MRPTHFRCAATASCAPVLLLLAALSASALNFAPQFARVLSDPRGDPRSYFGYSVALRRLGHGAEIIVGAPRANDFNANISSTEKPGAVYVCNTQGTKVCVPLLSDKAGNIRTSQIIGNRQDGGLGSAMAVQDNGDAILTCAPRWKSDEICKMTNNKNVPIYSRPNGICYLTSNTTYPAKRAITLYPFSKCDGQVYYLKNYYFTFAEGGMSVQILKNSSEIILGAPGIMRWRGAVLRYRFGSTSSNDKIDIPCPICNVLPDNSYFGYAVDYGKFTSSGEILYVSSAPRAANNKGKILVFDFEENNRRYHIVKEREGTQLGEYFGSSLCVADFNKDGLDDLLVGAPQHTVKTNIGDEGCVYVLLSTEDGWKDLGEKGKIAGSDKAGARFGTAIALLGDINFDGHPDVAVGAPYENNRQGAIYIYCGNKNGLRFPHTQKIIPSEKLFLRGFGASISRGLDVDGNSVNDIAVGAYISGHTVLIKAYPVVSVKAKFISSKEEITFTTDEFGVKLCFSYLEKYESLNVGIVITLKLDQSYKRVSFQKDRTNYTSYYNISLESSKSLCQPFTLFIKNQTEFSKPIELFVEYKLLMPAPLTFPGPSVVFDNEKDEFCKNCAVLSPEGPQKKILHIPYIPDSAAADLFVTANFINVTSPYIIGTSSNITFVIVLRNKKEQAIESYISITSPLSLLKKIPQSCQVHFRDPVIDILELLCDVESPFLHGNEHRIVISLNMDQVSSDLLQLNMSVVAKSRSFEENEEDNQANLLLPLERLYELEMHGRSLEYTFVKSEDDINDEESGKQDMVKQHLFKHNYQIMNYGPSPAQDFKLFFDIPCKILQSGVPIEALSIIERITYLDQQPLSCTTVETKSIKRHMLSLKHDEMQYPSNRTFILSCSEDNVLCTTIKCSINSLSRSSSVNISFDLKVMTEKLGAVMGMKYIILLKTFGHIESSTEKSTEVQSVVWTKPPATTIDMEVIAICVACGFLIFLTLVLLLIKCGFFTRQDPMEKYFRKKAALAQKTNSVPATTFFSPRGSIMVF